MKILAVTVSVLIVALTVLGSFTQSRQRSEIYGLASDKYLAVSQVICADMELDLLAGKVDTASMVQRETTKFAEIRSLAIYNKNGRPAFAADAVVHEGDSLEKLRAHGAPIVSTTDGRMVILVPLWNKPACRGCHAGDGNLLGAVKSSVDLERVQQKVARLFYQSVGVGLLAMLVLVLFLWYALSRIVARPLRALGVEAAKMADGDFSFDVELRGRDDIGRLQEAIRDALAGVSGILRRVLEVTGRVAQAAGRVEKDSERVVESTEMEAKAIADISSSVQELNASIREIADSVEVLAASTEETSASMEEMAASIASVGSTVHQLTGGVQATSSSIEELSASLKEVAESAGELADVSDSMLSSVERIISSVGDIEQSVKESARLSERVTTEASTMGVSSMGKMTRGMEGIKGSVEKTAGALKKLGGRSEEIGKIITVIDGITDQTKLLALNAAVLSAQAGEKGKGFGVVAEEMKELAKRTALSTKEIALLIDAVREEAKTSEESMGEALASVAEGTTLSREAAESFGKILESARSSSQMSVSIDRSTGEQARVAREVSASVEKMRAMVRRMALTTAEQSRGIALIMQATEKIRDASLQVQVTSDQQKETSTMISRAVLAVSEKSRLIKRAIDEQKQGAGQIWAAVEMIKDIPRQSKDIAFGVNRTLREVVKDVELIKFEMDSFKLHEEESGVLKFGIVPVESAVVMYQKYLPLARYLTERLGRKVELRVAPNFEIALKELGEGVTSLCSVTSMVYIEARRKYGAETLVTVKRNGRSFHHSVIVARADARINSLRDLKGCSVAFVDEKAAAGYVMPRGMLLVEGVELSDLSYYNFTGTHDEVARAVLRGEFDAGGMMESTAKAYRDQGLSVLKVSDTVPEWNICGKGLDRALQHAVQEALLALNETVPEHAAVLHAIDACCSGFVKSADEDHDGMRAVMSRLGLL